MPNQPSHNESAKKIHTRKRSKKAKSKDDSNSNSHSGENSLPPSTPSAEHVTTASAESFGTPNKSSDKRDMQRAQFRAKGISIAADASDDRTIFELPIVSVATAKPQHHKEAQLQWKDNVETHRHSKTKTSPNSRKREGKKKGEITPLNTADDHEKRSKEDSNEDNVKSEKEARHSKRSHKKKQSEKEKDDDEKRRKEEDERRKIEEESKKKEEDRKMEEIKKKEENKRREEEKKRKEEEQKKEEANRIIEAKKKEDEEKKKMEQQKVIKENEKKSSKEKRKSIESKDDLPKKIEVKKEEKKEDKKEIHSIEKKEEEKKEEKKEAIVSSDSSYFSYLSSFFNGLYTLLLYLTNSLLPSSTNTNERDGVTKTQDERSDTTTPSTPNTKSSSQSTTDPTQTKSVADGK